MWTADKVSAPLAAGDPFGYVLGDGTECIVYRGVENFVYHLYKLPGKDWQYENITLTGGAAHAAGDPMAYLLVDGTQSVIYRGQDRGVYYLWSQQQFQGWHGANITSPINAPPAVGNPEGYILQDGTQRVVYRSPDRIIVQLSYGAVASQPNLKWQAVNLSHQTGAHSNADGDPNACVLSTGGQMIFYRGADNHLYAIEQLSSGSQKWSCEDVTGTQNLPKGSAPVPQIAGNPKVYLDSSGLPLVICRDTSGVLHRLISNMNLWSCEKIERAYQP
jgi:hypothetical protein